MRCLERTLRRAALPVAVTQGFNPRPKATFAQALALGIEGRREVLDLELNEPMRPDDVLRRLAAEAPPGLDFFEAEAVGPGRAARVVAASYRLMIPEDRRDGAASAVAVLISREALPNTRHRPDRTVELDLRPFVLGAALAPGGVLEFRMKIAPDGSARPEEVLDALGLKDLLSEGAVLIREDVELFSHPVRARRPPPALSQDANQPLPVGPEPILPREQKDRAHEEGNADQRAPARGVPDRHRRRRRPRRAVRRTHQPRELYREHLQGQGRQPRARHPGRVHRLLGRPQRVPPRLRRRAPVLPPTHGRRRRARPPRPRPRTPPRSRGGTAPAARVAPRPRGSLPRTRSRTPRPIREGPPRPQRAPVRRRAGRGRGGPAAPAPIAFAPPPPPRPARNRPESRSPDGPPTPEPSEVEPPEAWPPRREEPRAPRLRRDRRAPGRLGRVDPRPRRPRARGRVARGRPAPEPHPRKRSRPKPGPPSRGRDRAIPSFRRPASRPSPSRKPRRGWGRRSPPASPRREPDRPARAGDAFRSRPSDSPPTAGVRRRADRRGRSRGGDAVAADAPPSAPEAASASRNAPARPRARRVRDVDRGSPRAEPRAGGRAGLPLAAESEPRPRGPVPDRRARGRRPRPPPTTAPGSRDTSPATSDPSRRAPNPPRPPPRTRRRPGR